MALIGQIRKRSWILIVLIGIGLGGFILMDFISAKQRGGGSSDQMVLGKVNGEKVSREKFDQAYSLLYSSSTGDVNGRRNFLWNYFVEEKLVKSEADKLGLGISDTELEDLEFGTNPSRIIVQRFPNPNAPGQVDRAQLNNIKQMIDAGTIQDAIDNGQLSPQFFSYWRLQREEIRKDRLQTKIDKLVEQAMYTPGWMTKVGFEEQSQFVDFSFVKVPYDEIDPTEVNLSDADYDAYVKENAELYRQKEELREISFVAFDVKPTEADRELSKNKLADLIDGFITAEKDSAYVLRYGGVIDPAYFTADQLTEAIRDTVFKMETGDVYGPYEEAGVFKIVKVRDRKMIPDSVQSRHILRPANDYDQFVQAKKTIDSLKTLIEDGTNTFEELAANFGTDATASNGGDLGYTISGGMVKPFNDLIFFEAEKGELNTVVTQFGVHLVEVTGKKFINNKEGVQVAYLSEDIVPSEETRNKVYEKANVFVGQNRTLEEMIAAAGEDPNITVETTPPLKASDYTVGSLGATDDARDIVKWAFSANKGTVSNVVYTFKDQTFFYDNKYVAVALKAIQKPGIPSGAFLRDQIETQVMNKKRAEMIMSQIEGMDMNAIAAKYSVPIDTANRVSFSSPFVPDLGGNEPKVVATAFALDNEETSKPIDGITGVYMVKMINKPILATPTGLQLIRQTMTRNDRGKVASQLIQSIVDKAKVNDNRSTFY